MSAYTHFGMTARCVTNISAQGQGWVALGNESFLKSAGTMETVGQVRGTGCALLVLRAVKLKAG